MYHHVETIINGTRTISDDDIGDIEEYINHSITVDANGGSGTITFLKAKVLDAVNFNTLREDGVAITINIGALTEPKVVTFKMRTGQIQFAASSITGSPKIIFDGWN